MTPTAIRTMRAALGWTLRDLAEKSGLGLGTVLRAEQGEAMTRTTIRRLRDAFRVQGVTARQSGDRLTINVRAAPSAPKSIASTDLLGLRHVSVRPRADGTFRVLFEVPVRLRPRGWPATRPLPATGRTGRLDATEVAAIKTDAKRLMADLERARRIAGRTGSTIAMEKRPLSHSEVSVGIPPSSAPKAAYTGL